MYTEKMNVPAAYFEWMMTDQCGLTSVSVTPNVPPMVLDPGASLDAPYIPPVSRYQGNAAQFSGIGQAGARSKPSGLFNINISDGLTMSMWLYARSDYHIPMLEFGYDDGSTYTAGMHFWLARGYLVYDGKQTVTKDYQHSCIVCMLWSRRNDFVVYTVRPGAGVSGAVSNSYPWYAYSLPVGVWLHAALVYYPTAQAMSIYVNGTLLVTYSLGGTLSVSASPAW
jgi:hypothetical protein